MLSLIKEEFDGTKVNDNVEKPSQNISRNYIRAITMKLAASMVLHAASPFLHSSVKRLGERSGQQTSMMLSRLLLQPSMLSVTSRIDFDEKEAKVIYSGIMATATKSNIALRSPQGVASAVDRFLASMDRNGCGNYRRECVAHWTKLFATDEVVYNEPIIQNFLSFIDHMSCCADTYVSLGGSNGCADQLTNWDGTQKLGLGAPSKKKSQGLSR